MFRTATVGNRGGSRPKVCRGGDFGGDAPSSSSASPRPSPSLMRGGRLVMLMLLASSMEPPSRQPSRYRGRFFAEAAFVTAPPGRGSGTGRSSVPVSVPMQRSMVHHHRTMRAPPRSSLGGATATACGAKKRRQRKGTFGAADVSMSSDEPSSHSPGGAGAGMGGNNVPLFELNEDANGGAPPAFLMPDDGADDWGVGAEHTSQSEEMRQHPSSSFSPVDASTGIAFVRDEDDIQTEREDRLYTDETGAALKREKCILVGVEDLSAARRSQRRNMAQNRQREWAAGAYFSLEESMEEMRELIKTAGMELVGEVTQRLNEPNPKTYVGTGKVQETNELALEQDCCTIVFDAELTPGQQKALENAFNKKILQNDFLGAEGEIKVIDRTALILDIFAQHAKTREGKLQVDLALHEYRKPRLTRMWTHLERQSGAGGVGLRGPGESQLEIDKRLLRDRIIVLKKKIDDVQKQRDLHRRGRDNLGLPVLSLVGYTNAGKSTLLNYLTRAGAMAEDILFATLDPTTRRVKLPGLKTHPEVLMTDTVGFIQKLPTQLVAAFRATLEEVREADVLVHVIDASNPMWEKQEAAVNKVLAEIGAADKPMVRVLNKIDLLDGRKAEELKYDAALAGDHSVAVSSLTGDGMEDFVSNVEDALADLLVPIEVEIPFSKGEELNAIHEVGNVEVLDYRPSGTYVMARVPLALANRLQPYSVDELSMEMTTTDVYEESGDGDEDNEEIDWVAVGRGRHSSKS